MDILADQFVTRDLSLEDDITSLMNGSSVVAMDPYPFYPVLDGASDMCIGGQKSEGCDVCGVSRTFNEDLGMFSCSPDQLPLLDWTDIQDQLGGDAGDMDNMQCVNMNQVFDMTIKVEVNSDLEGSDTDKVISDCMLSSSSAHKVEQCDLTAPIKVELSPVTDAEFCRPETPQTDSDAQTTDSDDLIHRVPKPSLSVRRLPVALDNSPVANGRSLLKRNQLSLKVTRGPVRPEVKCLPSPPSTDNSSFSGDHSYSASNSIGLLTPSPSASESSSEDDAVDPRSARRCLARHRRSPLDSDTVADRLLHRPLKARKRSGSHKQRAADRSRFASDDDPPQPERRHNHNNMERMRRDLLRGALHSLRRLVPDTATNEKAPKITVLREAAKYNMMLRAKDETLMKQKRRLEETRAALLRKLELLKRSVQQ